MKPAHRARGSVVLELALTIPVLLVMLIYLLFYGRVLYSYEVAQKAAHDAARYLSTASAVNMKSSALFSREVNVALYIANEELSVLNAGAGELYVFALCDGHPCTGFSLPATVGISVNIQLQNLFPGYVMDLANQPVLVTQTMRYAGN